MANYLSVEQARPMSGLRLVAIAHAPGLWSEACKSLFDAKKVPYLLVEQMAGGGNLALKEWTAQTSAPVAIWNDERPRSLWIEQLYLAERLAPEPALIPADVDDRITMFGLCNELCGENGFAWNLRLRMMHMAETSGANIDEHTKGLLRTLAVKYNYDPAAVEPGRNQQRQIVVLLRDRLREQQARGRDFLIGDALSALDIYWAAMAGAIDPLSEDLCPNMPPSMRAAYTDPELAEVAGPALLAHRDRIYRDFLKLPMDF
jgi:glutathione S-transferase